MNAQEHDERAAEHAAKASEVVSKGAMRAGGVPCSWANVHATLALYHQREAERKSAA